MISSLSSRPVGGLPLSTGGSASAFIVSRPARRSLAFRPAWSLSRPRRPFYQSASAHVVTSMNRSGRYQPERQLLGGIRTHQEGAPFHGALYIIAMYITRQAGPRRLPTGAIGTAELRANAGGCGARRWRRRWRSVAKKREEALKKKSCRLLAAIGGGGGGLVRVESGNIHRAGASPKARKGILDDALSGCVGGEHFGPLNRQAYWPVDSHRYRNAGAGRRVMARYCQVCGSMTDTRLRASG